MKRECCHMISYITTWVNADITAWVHCTMQIYVIFVQVFLLSVAMYVRTCVGSLEIPRSPSTIHNVHNIFLSCSFVVFALSFKSVFTQVPSNSLYLIHILKSSRGVRITVSHNGPDVHGHYPSIIRGLADLSANTILALPIAKPTYSLLRLVVTCAICPMLIISFSVARTAQFAGGGFINGHCKPCLHTENQLPDLVGRKIDLVLVDYCMPSPPLW